MRTTWHIRGGRVIDPSSGRDRIGDLLIRDGRIADPDARPDRDVPVLDARGLVVVPGLFDLHVHFREPGDEDSETLESGASAAARGGFCRVLLMPNTQPAVDTPERVAWLRARAASIGRARLLPAACITRGRQGAAPADLAAMADAGAVAFTDDGTTPADAAVMRRALEAAARVGRPILDHALDPTAAARGVMHAGPHAERLRLPGISAEAETDFVHRDISLAEQTGGRLHIQHVSCGESVARLREARRRGVRVTAEVTPHHLALTDADVQPANPDFKMMPPLRSEQDRQALIEAVAAGTVSALATDHAPHRPADKAGGFLAAAPGIAGLETAVGITYSLLVKSGRLSLADWLRLWTAGPASVLDLPCPSLAPGQPADVCVLDLDSEWTVRSAEFLSRSRNTPFEGWKLVGRAVYTFCGGVMTFRLPARPDH